MKKAPLPTDAELAILSVLWTRGPSTVREVHEALEPEQGTGYTTALKLLQIMAQKGLVERDERTRSHVYKALLGREQTQKRLLRDLLARAFSGSTAQLVQRALATKPTSKEELTEIRRMLDALEGEER
ncbi:MAG: BlaI/MecI/CopY family transcriptional regulator [Myxococcota bacterium]